MEQEKNISSKIHSTVPVIGTDNIKKSIIYYTKVLGFLSDFEYGNPVVYAGVKSGDAEIYFSYDPEIVNLIKDKKISPEIFIWLSDADNLFKEHVKNGAEIIEPISDRPWGARQYVVKDINGYHLKFAQPL
ncbi:VOC family protein [Pinibacter soli]|uniref:VOC domain-containing protein n=1 Tax=Pinibacter soli TaxID=3044211 RepID=A0ABT6RA72_9BACT|nr:VOC family protein [Pinibacter soli]MDI3319477.1 hypothetical protein [Pinibacter soli]